MSTSLKDILDNDAEDIVLDLPEVENIDVEKKEEDETLCSECEDMTVEVNCLNCNEGFCGGCFNLIHTGGKRKNHEFEKIEDENKLNDDDAELEKDYVNVDGETEVIKDSEAQQEQEQAVQVPTGPTSTTQAILNGIQSKIEFIPLRLTYEERFYLNLLDSALNVSEYTDKVDIFSYVSKPKRIVEQIKQICSILIGLVYSSNFKKGEKLIKNKDFKENSEFFKAIFEIGRRYKILNPNKLKANFGKLCYIIMDSKLPEVEAHLEFNLYKPINTIKTFIKSKTSDDKIWNMFQDENLIYATSQIDSLNRSRLSVQRDIKTKETAIKRLVMRYSSVDLSEDDIKQIIYSIDDYNSYVFHNRNPTNRFIKRLREFADDEVASRFSIGISRGRSGSKLTHDHNKQYNYVLQSLTLWSIIQREMIYLWSISDDDLFNGVSYKLVSTGQGLNRVKACPKLYKIMYKLIGEAKAKCNGSWIGSSVVHLGDDAVPNALFFLDKYIQIPNILIPIDQVLNKIPELFKDEHINEMLAKNYNNMKELELRILQDCFAHMFDGSGADNFFMSGSCIDGRLTSAWNFTNEIHKKEYFKVFLLTGFIGFNGDD
ncbi:hypothetical protein WICPIJ_004027 [Wickerhamomyces pijperi]|uniref:B box-type domain-containing protein n=1 Tax=Wickerhamomyces pijperi TaxID=599730 RepID=A0A9P8TNA8_WICPI|nr:hypothetical protein WICPIJ_004027 [Wickerhamomyces pijperi]